MTKIVDKVKSFYDEHKYGVIMTGLMLFFVLVNFVQLGNRKTLKEELAVAEKKNEVAAYNLTVANDTIRAVKDRAGRIEYEKLAFYVDGIESLKKLNADLAQEVKNIKGEVSTIIKGDVKIIEKEVPLIVRPEILDSNVYAHYNYDTTYSEGNYRKLSGYTKVDLKTGQATGEKTVDEIGVSVVTGVTGVAEGKPKIFFKSQYPGFSVTSLTGAELDPSLFKATKKPNRFGVGIIAGYTPLSYDFKTKNVSIKNQISAGVGFTYKIF